MVNRDNSVIYVANICSSELYNNIYGKRENKPSQQSQKYHKLLAEGFSNFCSHVEVISALPDTPYELLSKKISIADDVENRVNYHYVEYYINKILKYCNVVLQSYCETKKIIENEKNVVVIYDVLSAAVSLGAILAAKRKKVMSIAVVTDLPDMFEKPKIKLVKYLSNMLINIADGYSFMTSAMDERVNMKKRPSVILEGHVDIRENIKTHKIKKLYKKFVCMYAGGVEKQYGLDRLVQAFVRAKVPNWELHIYGTGGYVDELQMVSKENSSVKYMGSRINEEIMQAEYEADLLINPRPTNEEYVKYSFPSKNMEYMVTGTPVLTTRLPGMPKEYENYVYFIDDESIDGICKKLVAISQLDESELVNTGTAARLFVLKEKNNEVQAKKIYELFVH